MNYFSVPSDFKTTTIDSYKKLNDSYVDSKVFETYGNLTQGNLFGSGRRIDSIPQVDFDTLEKYVKYSKMYGIGFNYTINPSTINNIEFTKIGVNQIQKLVTQLYNIGIGSFTIALPSLIELVKSLNLDIEIKASAVAFIDNASKALRFKQMGVHRIVIENSINRDFDKLKKIREKVGQNIEVIVNPVCVKNCVYRTFHYNFFAGLEKDKNIDASNYYNLRCLKQRYQNASNHLKISWIRPEDLVYYNQIGINYFKLQGRSKVLNGDIVKTVEHYFKKEYNGDLMDLIDLFTPSSSFNVKLDNRRLDNFLKPIFQKEFCKEDCDNCNYCENYFKENIYCNDNEENRKLYDEFFNQFDEYNKILTIQNLSNEKEINNEPILSTSKNKEESGFNFS